MDYLTKYKIDFWSQVAVAGVGECWLWKGRVDRSGYGIYKGQRSHRIALFLSGVPHDARHALDHQCQVKNCVSPFHLTVMTPSDHDRITRARQMAASNPGKQESR